MEELKLPNLEFLKFENMYSSNFDKFNFKIIPNKSNATFKIFIWLGNNCLDYSSSKKERNFNLSEEGHKQGQQWIYNEFKKFNKIEN